MRVHKTVYQYLLYLSSTPTLLTAVVFIFPLLLAKKLIPPFFFGKGILKFSANIIDTQRLGKKLSNVHGQKSKRELIQKIH